MNRTLIFGIAIFFAVVGIALMGGDSKAVAGHGCHGCNGCNGGHHGCHGGDAKAPEGEAKPAEGAAAEAAKS